MFPVKFIFMTKITLNLIVLFIVHNLSFSQSKKDSDLKISYSVYWALDIPYKYQSNLYIKNNISIWQELQNTRELWQEKPVAQHLKSMQIDKDAFKVDAAPCIKTDMNNREILFHGGIMKNWFLVKDNFIDISWSITSESKMIAGYSCIKATGIFRGRDWIVWFTPDIALPFGPWKLHGLPGLILDAEDISHTYRYIANQIVVDKGSTIFEKDFASLMPLKNTKIYTYKQLLADEDEAKENADKEISQQLKVTITREKSARDKDLEIKYEWEE